MFFEIIGYITVGIIILSVISHLIKNIFALLWCKKEQPIRYYYEVNFEFKSDDYAHEFENVEKVIAKYNANGEVKAKMECFVSRNNNTCELYVKLSSENPIKSSNVADFVSQFNIDTCEINLKQLLDKR